PYTTLFRSSEHVTTLANLNRNERIYQQLLNFSRFQAKVDHSIAERHSIRQGRKHWPPLIPPLCRLKRPSFLPSTWCRITLASPCAWCAVKGRTCGTTRVGGTLISFPVGAAICLATVRRGWWKPFSSRPPS